MCFLKKGGPYTIFRGTGGGGELGGPAAGGSCGCSSLYIALPFTLQILFFFLQVFLLEENYYGRVVLAGSVTETDAPGCNHPFLSDHHLVI